MAGPGKGLDRGRSDDHTAGPGGNTIHGDQRFDSEGRGIGTPEASQPGRLRVLKSSRLPGRWSTVGSNLFRPWTIPLFVSSSQRSPLVADGSSARSDTVLHGPSFDALQLTLSSADLSRRPHPDDRRSRPYFAPGQDGTSSPRVSARRQADGSGKERLEVPGRRDGVRLDDCHRVVAVDRVQ